MSKLISVLGAGESGVGAALLAKAKGFDVFVSDKGQIGQKYKDVLVGNNVAFEEGNHSESTILSSEIVIKSPGISDKVDIVKKLEAAGVKVISEIEFASKYTSAKFIAITGSNGKTTTTLLTYHILKTLGLNVGLAGNVGESLAKQVIENKFDLYVLELSSFQLDGMFDFKADIAILLNITPDHLDRYDYDFKKYINAKFRILQNMKSDDIFITFVDDPVLKEELSYRDIKPFLLSVSLEEKVINGAYMSDQNIIVNFNNVVSKFYTLESLQIPLQGKHNMINAMSAILVASALNQDENKIISSLSGFKNAPNRLEPVLEINGVAFINDSKATNVDSVWYALDSMKKPVVLIMGGQDKGNDYTKIVSLVKKKVKAIICLGIDNSKIVEAFGQHLKVVETNQIKTAVRSAYEAAAPGDIVLLSPACASFDLFRNYEDRGEQFKLEVKNLSDSIKI